MVQWKYKKTPPWLWKLPKIIIIWERIGRMLFFIRLEKENLNKLKKLLDWLKDRKLCSSANTTERWLKTLNYDFN